MENSQQSGLCSSHVNADGLTVRDLLKLRGDEELTSDVESSLLFLETKQLDQSMSEQSDDTIYVDAFDLLPDIEKDVSIAIAS